ncbi:MAG: Hpt domain-containing protein, partial [Leucothrix sp.]
MTPKQSANSERSPIESLSAILTPQQVSHFVKKAVPDLKLATQSLQESLEQQRWDEAAEHAHRLKSTISLFCVDALVESLDSIEEGRSEVIQLPEFTDNLVAQCQQLI